MTCADFLRQYSGYRDGIITDPVLLRRLDRHLLMCRTCMQYDARVARGVTLLRTFNDLEPSGGFRRTLANRLAGSAGAVDEPVTPGPASVMVGLMVAAGLALVFWTGSDRQTVAEPIIAQAPAPEPLPAVVANPGVPFVSFADLSVPPFAPPRPAPGANDQGFITLTTAP